MATIHELLISSRDAEALAGVVGYRHGRDGPENEAKNALADVLIGAPLVPHERLPADRVAMNSRVTYREEPAGARRKPYVFTFKSPDKSYRLNLSFRRSTVNRQDLITALQEVYNLVEEIPKVVVAAVTGYALGGGCELALCADFRLAADDARLGQPEITLGIIPGAGGTQRLPRLIGPARAKDLIYSGRMVSAEEALAIGLVDRVHPAAEVHDRAAELARGYAKGPRAALRAAKVAINWGARGDVRTGLVVEREAFVGLFATEDQREGMQAFVEKRRAEFTGR